MLLPTSAVCLSVRLCGSLSIFPIQFRLREGKGAGDGNLKLLATPRGGNGKASFSRGNLHQRCQALFHLSGQQFHRTRPVGWCSDCKLTRLLPARLGCPTVGNLVNVALPRERVAGTAGLFDLPDAASQKLVAKLRLEGPNSTMPPWGLILEAFGAGKRRQQTSCHLRAELDC